MMAKNAVKTMSTMLMGQLALRSLTSETWPLLPVTVVKDLRLPGEMLVDAQDQAAQQDGDKRDDVALTLIAGLNQRTHLGGERIALHRRAEEHGHGVRAEAAGKDQQEGRENRGHDDRDGHAADNRRAAGLENRCAFLKCRIHIFENAADEQIRERGVMQAVTTIIGNRP